MHTRRMLYLKRRVSRTPAQKNPLRTEPRVSAGVSRNFIPFIFILMNVCVVVCLFVCCYSVSDFLKKINPNEMLLQRISFPLAARSFSRTPDILQDWNRLWSTTNKQTNKPKVTSAIEQIRIVKQKRLKNDQVDRKQEEPNTGDRR